MEFREVFTLWNKLTAQQQQLLQEYAVLRDATKGTVIHNGSIECTGLILVQQGQLRAYYLSEEGREITLYRLFDRDICMLSAACIMRSIQFDIIIEAEKDTRLWIIPPVI